MRFYTHVGCHGNSIYYRGVENGKRIQKEIPYTPTMYLPTKSTDTPFRSLNGEHLAPKSFESIDDARAFIKQYEEVAGFTIYGNARFEYAYIAEEHPEELIQWQQDQIVVAYIDIEVSSEDGFGKVETADKEITAITIKFSNDPQYYAFGCGDFVPHQKNIIYVHCRNEHDLLSQFLKCWQDSYPDVISGWNIKTFDIPYLYNRIKNIKGEAMARALSPWGKVYEKPEQFYGKDIQAYELVGIATLDYLQLFRKYAANYAQESYKLDHIAFVELKERKLSYDEYDSLHDLYLKNFQKFMEYNVKDVNLVERLNAKGRLIDMALTLAYDNKTNYSDVFQQVRMWDAICYNHLLRNNIIIPPKKHTSKDKAYEGAYVKDPQLGMYEWIASFDLNSLYPHLIMQYNLSPECLVEDPTQIMDMKDVTVHALLNQRIDLSILKQANYTVTPNKQLFKRDFQGFLPEIMQKMYDGRVIYKKKMIEAKKLKEQETDPEKKKDLDDLIARYNNLQLAKKVGLNSAYGAMGNEFFRFFDTRIAEAVTLSGQLSIRWIENRLNDYMNTALSTNEVDYILASDTDSVYLNLGPLVKRCYKDNLPETVKIITFMDKVCQEKIQPFIEEQYTKLADYVNAFEQKMQMKRESLVDKAIWTAKKRYILNVWDEEGVRYTEPKLKIQGLEAIKSSTPTACRDKIKEALKIILKGEQTALQDYIEKFRQEFLLLPAEEIAFPRSVNGLSTYNRTEKVITLDGAQGESSKGGVPIHVRGALLYNQSLKDMNIENLYPSIQEGEKIKFIYLKHPNRFHSHVIAFGHRCPKEFHLENVIDYQIQFDKSFVEPLKIILNSIGWKAERESTLEDLFA